MITSIVIPARLNSSRFPKKVLADLHGKPLIQWVYEIGKKANLGEVYLLIDSVEVADVAESFGANVVMTSPDCSCGTDRAASVVDRIGGDFIINLQGDEPLLDYGILIAVADRARTSSADIVTPIFRMTDAEDLDDPSRVKVAVCHDGRALYFSRSPIPFIRGVERAKWFENYPFFCHIGVYGYRRDVLERYPKFRQSALEVAESLEQLRFLDNGSTIDTVVVTASSFGIDTPEDLVRAKNYIGTGNFYEKFWGESVN
jgi:3-deoxy-manno-octulosonate cytidylyltransferase (CMP-KDO synthetase)